MAIPEHDVINLCTNKYTVTEANEMPASELALIRLW
jgi:hypothetical protein